MMELTTKTQNRKRGGWFRQIRYWYCRWLRLEATPTAFARGLAVGVFAGWFPLFGLQTILSVAIAAMVGGNKIAAAAGTWVSNPLTYLPIYFCNFQLGRILLNTRNQPFTLSAVQSWESLSQLGQEFMAALFLGSFVGGLVAGGVSYVLGFHTMARLKHRRRRS